MPRKSFLAQRHTRIGTYSWFKLINQINTNQIKNQFTAAVDVTEQNQLV